MPQSAAQARSFFTALRDRWWIVALCALAAGVAAYVTVHQRPGQYQAGAILGLKNQYLDRDIFQLSASQKTTEQTLAEQPGQLDTLPAVVALAQRLGLQPATDARELAANTSVSLDTRFFLPVVQGRDRNAKKAARLANTFALVLVQRRRKQDERRIQKAIEATRERVDDVARQAAKEKDYLRLRYQRNEVNRLTEKLIRLRLLKQFRPPTISVARWAPIPTARTRAPAIQIGIAAALFGAMMGCGLLAWREQRDRRPRAGLVLFDLRAAILSDLPRAALLPGARPHGPFVGERAALDAVHKVLQSDRPHTTIAVTEAVSLGRAGAAARLLAQSAGAAASADQRRTLLATNDPHVSEGDAGAGLTIERYPIEAGEASKAWLAARRESYDLVIIDLPSPVGSSAALELASQADQVLVVWVADSITRRQVSRLGRTLRRADIPLAGVLRVGGAAA